MSEVYEDDFGLVHCGICGEELLCNENGDMPEKCPKCVTELDYTKI